MKVVGKLPPSPHYRVRPALPYAVSLSQTIKQIHWNFVFICPAICNLLNSWKHPFFFSSKLIFWVKMWHINQKKYYIVSSLIIVLDKTFKNMTRIRNQQSTKNLRTCNPRIDLLFFSWFFARIRISPNCKTIVLFNLNIVIVLLYFCLHLSLFKTEKMGEEKEQRRKRNWWQVWTTESRW